MSYSRELKETIYITCPTCGKEFRKIRRNHKYCSVECRPGYKKKPFREQRVCDVCGDEYTAKQYNQKYCSKECSIISLRENIVYEQERIYVRDGYRCAYCGKTSYSDNIELHADHIMPKSKGGKDTFGNLITSCKKCNLTKNTIILDAETLSSLLKETSERNKIFGVSDNTKVRLGGSRKRIEQQN